MTRQLIIHYLIAIKVSDKREEIYNHYCHVKRQPSRWMEGNCYFSQRGCMPQGLYWLFAALCTCANNSSFVVIFIVLLFGLLSSINKTILCSFVCRVITELFSSNDKLNSSICSNSY